jgi:hypothetical protein
MRPVVMAIMVMQIQVPQGNACYQQTGNDHSNNNVYKQVCHGVTSFGRFRVNTLPYFKYKHEYARHKTTIDQVTNTF